MMSVFGTKRRRTTILNKIISCLLSSTMDNSSKTSMVKQASSKVPSSARDTSILILTKPFSSNSIWKNRYLLTRLLSSKLVKVPSKSSLDSNKAYKKTYKTTGQLKNTHGRATATRPSTWSIAQAIKQSSARHTAFSSGSETLAVSLMASACLQRI